MQSLLGQADVQRRLLHDEQREFEGADDLVHAGWRVADSSESDSSDGETESLPSDEEQEASDEEMSEMGEETLEQEDDMLEREE